MAAGVKQIVDMKLLAEIAQKSGADENHQKNTWS